jgi:hypothetical protein
MKTTEQQLIEQWYGGTPDFSEMNSDQLWSEYESLCTPTFAEYAASKAAARDYVRNLWQARYEEGVK